MFVPLIAYERIGWLPLLIGTIIELNPNFWNVQQFLKTTFIFGIILCGINRYFGNTCFIDVYIVPALLTAPCC